MSKIAGENLEYAGFWVRVLAALIDTIIVGLVTIPLSIMIYGPAYFDSVGLFAGPADFLLNWVGPAVFTIVFWVVAAATPGKMALGMKILCAETGQPITLGKSMLRYVGYFVSIIVIFLGFVWVAFDPKKQGWHDKIAGTVVVKKPIKTESVRFENG